MRVDCCSCCISSKESLFLICARWFSFSPKALRIACFCATLCSSACLARSSECSISSIRLSVSSMLSTSPLILFARCKAPSLTSPGFTTHCELAHNPEGEIALVNPLAVPSGSSSLSRTLTKAFSIVAASSSSLLQR